MYVSNTATYTQKTEWIQIFDLDSHLRSSSTVAREIYSTFYDRRLWKTNYIVAQKRSIHIILWMRSRMQRLSKFIQSHSRYSSSTVAKDSLYPIGVYGKQNMRHRYILSFECVLYLARSTNLAPRIFSHFVADISSSYGHFARHRYILSFECVLYVARSTKHEPCISYLIAFRGRHLLFLRPLREIYSITSIFEHL
jgi:hypothetical protein